MTLAPLLAHWRERPQRTWSVVVTVMGDAIVPRGGTVMLGALTDLFAAMGVDAGAVRTAMSRLVADGWTDRTRIGRTSAYRLSERGLAATLAAAPAIYAASPPEWDGRLHLILQPEQRDAVQAAGYGQALPGLFVSPRAAASPAGGIVLEASGDAEAIRTLAAKAWPVERVAAAFGRFNDVFAELASWTAPSPLDAMAARTLLIHDYRRLVLQAPSLPAAFLPASWPGETARALCAAAYAALLPASEAWLSENGLPPADPQLARRFQRVTDSR